MPGRRARRFLTARGRKDPPAAPAGPRDSLPAAPRSFESCTCHWVMPQDIGDTRTRECRSGCCSFGSAGGLLWVLRWGGSRGGGEGDFAQEFAGGGVDDPDVEVFDEQDELSALNLPSPGSKSTPNNGQRPKSLKQCLRRSEGISATDDERRKPPEKFRFNV